MTSLPNRCLCRPAVLGALSAVDQQLQALRSSLAASSAAPDVGQQLAGIASAWGAFLAAFNGSQVGPGLGRSCLLMPRQVPFLRLAHCRPALPLQLSLSELHAVAASLQTAAPLLGLPVLTTRTAAAVQRSQYAALTSPSGINLFR